MRPRTTQPPNDLMDAARSPSLRHPRREGGAASIGRSFDYDAVENDELPNLLIAPLIGILEYDSVLASYCLVNKRMHEAARGALATWLAALTKTRDEMFEAERRSTDSFDQCDAEYADVCDRKAAVLQIGIHSKLTRALGDNFVQLFGHTAMTCSVFSPVVYRAMRQRRCVLCGRSSQVSTSTFKGLDMTGAPEELVWHAEGVSVAGPSFTFAHQRCQLRHCIMLDKSGPIETAMRGHARGENSITAQFKPFLPRCVWQALEVYHLTPEGYGTAYRFEPSDLCLNIDRWCGTNSNLDESNAFDFGRIHWVQPMDEAIIRREDTLVGALGMSDAEVLHATDQACAYRDTLLAVKERAQILKREKEIRYGAERRGAILARLGLMHSQGLSPWSTIEEIGRVHPRALSRLGVTAWLDPSSIKPRATSTDALATVSSLVVFLAQICHNPPIGEDTLDFAMRCDDAWISCEKLSSRPYEENHTTDGHIVDFVKFMDCLTANQVTVGEVEANWSFKLRVAGLPAAPRATSSSANPNREVTITAKTSYASLRHARAYLETLGCAQNTPNLLLARSDADSWSSERTHFINAIIQCALSTPLEDGSTTRKARHVAYDLLNMDQVMWEWQHTYAWLGEDGGQFN